MDPQERIAATRFDDLEDAEHLPHALSDLRSPNARVRRAAVDALYRRLYRDKMVDHATLRAVPIVVDLANAASTPDRYALFVFLATLLSDLPRNWRDGFNNNGRPPPSDTLLRIEHEIVRGARGYASQVTVDDPRTRAAASALVAVLCGAPEFPKALHHQLVTVLRRQLVNETHPRARASAQLASALIGHRLGLTDTAELSRMDLRAQTPIVRVATAAALLRAANSADPVRDLPEAIVDALVIPVDPMSIHDFPWARGDPAILAAEAIAFGCEPTTHVQLWSNAESRAVAAVRTLVSARAPFRDVDDSDAPVARAKRQSLGDLSSLLLEIGLRAFGGRSEPVLASELSPDQLDLVRFLALECELDAGYDRFGLPPRCDIAKFVAAAEPQIDLRQFSTNA